MIFDLTPEELLLKNEIVQHLKKVTLEYPNQKMPFNRYMHETLYCPHLGYYCNPKTTIGSKGDFSTAPELSKYFGYALANFLSSTESETLIEFGAGTGKLALSILERLTVLNALPKNYLILEVSPYLRAQQQSLLSRKMPDYFQNIHWLDDFPTQPINGFMIANEILDAMPVSLFQLMEDNKIGEGFVSSDLELTFEVSQNQRLLDKVYEIQSYIPHPLPIGYTSEVNLNVSSWLKQISEKISTGGLLLIDYGFDRNTYYHPERAEGTLQCHYKHHHYSSPFLHPGLQDLTAHVDFTDIVKSACELNFSLYHYGNMASSLLDMGLLSCLTTPSPQESQALNLILQPHEMGELFKVMILTKNINSISLLPFTRHLEYAL